MAFPAARFTPATGQILGLRIPAEMVVRPAVTVTAAPADVLPEPRPELPPAPDAAGQTLVQAVEVDRVVPPSGNLWIAGQQIWLGPALSGRTVRLWVGLDRVHVLLGGHRIKTLPSRLDRRDLARLANAGALAAGPPLLPPHSGSVIELERTVTAAGNISIGEHVRANCCCLRFRATGLRRSLKCRKHIAHVGRHRSEHRNHRALAADYDVAGDLHIEVNVRVGSRRTYKYA